MPQEHEAPMERLMAQDVVSLIQACWPLLVAAGIPAALGKVRSMKRLCVMLYVGDGRVDLRFTTRPSDDETVE